MLPRSTSLVSQKRASGTKWECNGVNQTKATEQLQLSLGSALLTGAKIPKGPKLEELVPTVKRYKFRKRIRKDIGSVRSESQLRERMVFATPLSAKLEKAWQSKTCLQCCIKLQRSLLARLARLDLLHDSIGTIFGICEGSIALKTDFESRFLQLQFPD